MCNEEIIKHMEEDMTFRGLSERTMKSYIWRVSRYMEFHKGKDIEQLTEDDIRDFLKYLVEECKNKRRDVNTYNSAIRFMYGPLLIYQKQEDLKIVEEFDKFISSLYAKDWIVYCKPPFKNANSVIEYLGRYTHRVAISNSRILNIDNGKVTFKWRDYRDNNKMKIMVLSADEFIRRFILHILPPRFMKIRHSGLLRNRNKTKKLTLCKSLTNTKVLTKENISPLEILKKVSGKDFNLCPVCGIGHLIRPSPV